MDLNHINLSPSLVVELYPVELIDNGSETTTGIPQPVFADTVVTSTKENLPEPTPALKFLGNNQKNILVIVTEKQAVYLPDDSMAFLTGILNACKLSLEEVAIVNMAGYPGLSYKELVSRFQTRVMLLFATAPSSLGLPLNFPHFQIQPFSGVSYLSSPGLAELEHDKILKSKLWVCLKRLFNI